MRRPPLLLAFVLVFPAPVAMVRFAPSEHWETPAASGPQLTPPNPAVGTWPPFLRRHAPGPLPTPTQTTGVARIVVLLIDFTHVAPDPAHDGTYFDGRLNAGGSAHSGRAHHHAVCPRRRK